MITIRKFTEDDFDELVLLRREIEAVDQTGADTSDASLRAQFDWPNHQRWVIENPDDGNLVGHGWMFSQSDTRIIAQVFIHPDCRRKGVGSQLMGTIISYVKQIKMDSVPQIVSGALVNNEAGKAFLQAQGFSPVGNNRFFEAAADILIDEPVWPDGFYVKSCQQLGDLSMIVEGSNGCYADMWGHRENTELLTMAHVEENIKRWPNLYDPAGIFIVFDASDQLAGICFNRVDGNEQTKILDSPGVVPKYRHLALQRPLVQHSLRWLQQRADGKYHLHTFGDFDEAVQIYNELDFTLKPQAHLVEYLFVG